MPIFLKELHKLFLEPIFIGILLFIYLPDLSNIIFELRAEMNYSIEYVYNLLKNLFELILIITALIYVVIIYRKKIKQIENNKTAN